MAWTRAGCVLPLRLHDLSLEGTRLPTFSADLPADGVAALEQANAFLETQMGKDPGRAPRTGEQTIAESVVIPAGGSRETGAGRSSRLDGDSRFGHSGGPKADEMAARATSALDHIRQSRESQRVDAARGLLAPLRERTCIAVCRRE